VGHAATHGTDSYLASEATSYFGYVTGRLLIPDVHQGQASRLTCLIQEVQTMATQSGNKRHVSPLQFLYEKLDAFQLFLLL